MIKMFLLNSIPPWLSGRTLILLLVLLPVIDLEAASGAIDLRTDTRVNPIGLESRHLQFSWRLRDMERQGAWHVQVAGSEKLLTDGAPDLWDSGWREGDRAHRILYEGTPLKTTQSAWWRVRVRDGDGKESAWSDPATFEMGLLDPADWQDAAWIGCSRDMSAPQLAPREVMGDWISGPAGSAPNVFLTSFVLPDIPVVHAMAYWGVSKPGIKAIASVEGRIQRDERDRVTHPSRGSVDLSFQLAPGRTNTLRLDLDGQTDGVAVCFGLRIVFADGSEKLIRSGDGDWQATSQSVAGPPGYTQIAAEGESHTFDQTVDVAFGADGRFVFKRGVSGPVAFDRKYFGRDPAPGAKKFGFYRLAGAGDGADTASAADGPAAKVAAYGEAPYGEVTVFPRRQLAPAWFKTTVPVRPGLARARLYLSALSHGDTVINGKPVTDAVLTPPQTDYEDHAMYDIHDVTALLQPGDNALAVLLDPGWYHEVGGFGSVRSYGRPGLKALLRAEYDDGRTEFFHSGDSWRFKEGGLQEANTYLGERMDYRLEHDEWKRPAMGEGWEPVQVLAPLSPKLIPVDLPPVRRLREIKPVQSWQIGEKTWLYDLGENITGWIRLAFDEPAGAAVRIRYTEMLQDGRLRNVPMSHWWCHGMAQNDELISDGQPQVYETRFAYKGFRYFEVSGLSREPAPGEVTAFEVCSDVPMAATFESSDPLLNRLFANGRRSHYGNMVNSLLDCPHREKCLWGGDLHASWAFGFHALDPATFYRHQVRVSYTGPTAPGGIPANIMVGKRGAGNSTSFNWSVSPLFITWWLYQHDGDLETVREYYEPMLRFLRFFDEKADHGIPHLTALADHAPPGGIEREAPNNRLISAMNFFAAATRFAEMARALGKDDDAAWADGVAETARAAVMRFYRPDEHTFGNGTQDSLVLAFGIIPDPEENKRLAGSLVNHYRKNGHQFDGGFLSYWIYPMLSRYGYGDDALKMMRNPDYPGPAWSIEAHDATTFWELFTKNPAAQFQRSLNHHAINHPAAWLLTDLAGIRFDNAHPGEGRLILDPAVPVGEDLDWVNASLMTRHGKVESAWKKDGDAVTWEFSVPPNTRATLQPPQAAVLEKMTDDGAVVVPDDGETVVPPGSYRMRWTTDHDRGN
jgi:alpha-L-rhamnosidase